MISAAADDFNARVAELERFLDELDRRTHSNFTVTNPSSQVKHLEVGPINGQYQVVLRDDNGNTIYGTDPNWGLAGPKFPLPMYPSVPATGLVFGTTSAWVNCWQTTTFVQTSNMQISYRYKDFSPSGGTAELRVAYDAGAGLVTMSESVVSAVAPPHSVHSFSYTWPADFYDTEVDLFFQARMAAGSGATASSPIYLLGG